MRIGTSQWRRPTIPSTCHPATLPRHPATLPRHPATVPYRPATPPPAIMGSRSQSQRWSQGLPTPTSPAQPHQGMLVFGHHQGWQQPAGQKSLLILRCGPVRPHQGILVLGHQRMLHHIGHREKDIIHPHLRKTTPVPPVHPHNTHPHVTHVTS